MAGLIVFLKKWIEFILNTNKQTFGNTINSKFIVSTLTNIYSSHYVKHKPGYVEIINKSKILNIPLKSVLEIKTKGFSSTQNKKYNYTVLLNNNKKYYGNDVDHHPGFVRLTINEEDIRLRTTQVRKIYTNKFYKNKQKQGKYNIVLEDKSTITGDEIGYVPGFVRIINGKEEIRLPSEVIKFFQTPLFIGTNKNRKFSYVAKLIDKSEYYVDEFYFKPGFIEIIIESEERTIPSSEVKMIYNPDYFLNYNSVGRYILIFGDNKIKTSGNEINYHPGFISITKGINNMLLIPFRSVNKIYSSEYFFYFDESKKSKYYVILKSGERYYCNDVDHKPGFVWSNGYKGELIMPASSIETIFECESKKQTFWKSIGWGMPVDAGEENKRSRLKVFLCHSKADKKEVKTLHKMLTNEGYSPWFDEIDLVPGTIWDDAIKDAVKDSNIILVCLTNHSITKEGYVQKEIKYALDIADEKPDDFTYIIPVLFEKCSRPRRLRHIQSVNLHEEESALKLIQALDIKVDSL